MKNLYLSTATATPAKQLKQTAGKARLFFAKVLLAIIFMIAAAPANLFAQLPTISYSTPQTYTAGTAITPLIPTSTGVTTHAYSASIFGLSYPFVLTANTLAVDGPGNVYVTNGTSYNAVEFPAGGGAPFLIGGAFGYGLGYIAVDGAGNVYVGDDGNNAVKVIPAAGAGADPVTIYSGKVGAMAASPQGNLYMIVGNTVVEVPANGGSPVTVGSGFNGPQGLAADAAGNLYVADAGNNAVKKVPAGGGTPVIIGSGFNAPAAVAVDPAGNVYVQDYGNKLIKEIPASGGAPVVISNITGAGGTIAVDALGNLYTIYYANGRMYQFKVIGGYTISPALPAGLTFNSATGVISGTPTVATQATNYTVTAFNHVGSASAIVNIKTVAAGANLASLAISSGTVSPSFAAGTNNYTASVGNAVTSVTVTPTASTGTSTITVNGTTVASGSTSGSIPLSVGPNAINVKVTETGGIISSTYTITVTRAPLLTNLAISSGTLSPAFAATVTSYTATVNNDISSITVTPTSTPTGTVTVNGTLIPSGSQSANLPLAVGPNTITATIPGTGGATYTITVTRAASNVTLSYASPQVYIKGVPITALAPSGSGAVAPGYGNPVSINSELQNGGYVAVDPSGNIYQAQTYVSDASKNLLGKIPVNGGAPIILAYLPQFGQPGGVAADAAGNVYVSETMDDNVLKIPAGGGAPITFASGFDYPYGLAVDAAGNVYVADLGHTAVKKIPAGGGTPVSIGSGLSAPSNVAVDAAGDVFVAEQNNNLIKEIPASGGATFTLVTGLSGPTGLAADGPGNVFVTDGNGLKEIPVGGGPIVLLTSSYADALIAADAAGNIYVGGPYVTKLQPVGGYYINGLLPAGLTFNSTTGIISGTPTALSAATNYTVKAYSSSGSASAIVNITVNPLVPPTISYSNPNIYSTGNAITPLAPTSTLVAPQGYSTTPVAVGSGFVTPTGVAADAAGNVYIADFGNHLVKKAPAGGGAIVTLGSGFTSPYGVAVDAAGNVYVADYGASLVKEIPVGGGAIVTLGSGFSHPTALTVDGAGNIYVADYGHSAIKEIPTGNGTPVTLGSGFNTPTGVSVDGAGNVYVADFGNNAVKMIPAGNGTPVTVGPAFNLPHDVKIDAAGNLFVTEYNFGDVKEIPAGGDATVTLSSLFNHPVGIALNGAGNVYIADYSNNAIKQIKPVGGYYLSSFLPAGLSFSNVTGIISGTPTGLSAATNYTVTAYNGFASSTATVTIAIVNANLANLVLSSGPLTPAFAASTTSYKAVVSSATGTVTLTPTVSGAGATVTVNGTTVASGSASAAIPLALGLNPISTVVTAAGGTGTRTYTVSVGRGATDVTLANLTISNGALTPAFSTGTTGYTDMIANTTASITIVATATDPNATITANGIPVSSGVRSTGIPMNVGNNTLLVVVTAQNGITEGTYTVVVNRQTSNNALLSSISTNPFSTLNSSTGPGNFNFTEGAAYATSSIKVIPTAQNSGATITVNGAAVASGTASQSIPLAVGPNTLTTIVTAGDGVTTKSYIITVTRAAAPPESNLNQLISVTKPADNVRIENDSIVVHQGVSPNGDGVNDVFTIEGLAAYPQNKVSVLDRNGAVIYQANGYDNKSVAFDGHSNINGKMQLPGTYFYTLDYSVNGQNKHKTGFIILKY